MLKTKPPGSYSDAFLIYSNGSCYFPSMAARPVEGPGMAVCIYLYIECGLEVGYW